MDDEYTSLNVDQIAFEEHTLLSNHKAALAFYGHFRQRSTASSLPAKILNAEKKYDASDYYYALDLLCNDDVGDNDLMLFREPPSWFELPEKELPSQPREKKEHVDSLAGKLTDPKSQKRKILLQQYAHDLCNRSKTHDVNPVASTSTSSRPSVLAQMQNFPTRFGKSKTTPGSSKPTLSSLAMKPISSLPPPPLPDEAEKDLQKRSLRDLVAARKKAKTATDAVQRPSSSKHTSAKSQRTFDWNTWAKKK